MWYEGRINDFYYCLKSYHSPSPYGVSAGRVSKIQLWKTGEYGARRVYAHYERGWLVDVTDPEAAEALKLLLERFS